MLQVDRRALQERRERLSSLSWFMRCLAEPIARQANKEDGCTGRFWEGRFKCQVLLDEAAVLACSVYVDLNPIRAGIARSPETSTYTSGYERIRERGKSAGQRSGRGKGRRGKLSRPATDNRAFQWRGLGIERHWLCPVQLQRGQEVAAGVSEGTRRASDKGFLPLGLNEYLQLLDWTGRQVRLGKRGAIPSTLAPILERLRIASDTWVDMVVNFSRWFRQAAGRVDSLAGEAARRGRRWLHGLSRSQAAFI
jgi:hypothetical protein